MDLKVVCVVAAGCFLFGLAHASPMIDDTKGHINSVHQEKPTIEESLSKKLNAKCSQQDISSCLMLKLVTYFNKLMKKSNLEFGDVEITQTSTETIQIENSRSLNDIEKMSEEQQLTEVLADKALHFLRTRSLKWKGDASLINSCSSAISTIVPPLAVPAGLTRRVEASHPFVVTLETCRTSLFKDLFIQRSARLWNTLSWEALDEADVIISGNSGKDGALNLGLSLKPTKDVEEGRKKKNRGGSGMTGIIAAAVMKIGLIKALAFKALVLLVGKALLVSKLALVLAVVIGLKKLLSQEKHVTYEVVAHPHHEHHDHHSDHSGGGFDAHGSVGVGGGGWGRTFDAQAAQNLAYSAHIPAN
ncbi:unnamed protein product [Phaedon cochleariae]|uniref:Uncharacterized protein n=1 Tax=Phaedon cochleariae TaxID=80249 RepID=A0A9N9SFA8_PHACE|nr:unnamed protein product [Phaedon cochleariae]